MTLPGPVIAIVGPTASGKSALADHVAARLGSSVISVDAMQVYRGMDIGTAKVPPGQRAVPLLMVDVVDVWEDYSVQLFQHDARQCADALLAQEKTPVLCGGTGLYLDAVIDEMRFPSGERIGQTRSRYEALSDRIGAEALHEVLRDRDPKSAELIHPNNVRRVIRALEMLDEGVSYAEHHEGLLSRPAHYDARIWGVACDRATLYERIDRRVDDMYRRDLVEEVRELRRRGLVAESTAGQAIGYQEVLAYLDGTMSLDQARERTKTRTRRYAKRQLSWLRRDGRVRWLSVEDMGMEAAFETMAHDLRKA